MYRDAFRCKAVDEHGRECQYVCRTARSISKHCTDEHGWCSNQRHGGDARAKHRTFSNSLWEGNQVCQQFFVQGSWKRYFEVARTGAPTEGPCRAERMFRALATCQKAVENARKEEVIQASAIRNQGKSWLDFTRWPEHLKGFKPEALIHFIRQPAEHMVDPPGDRPQSQRQRQQQQSSSRQPADSDVDDDNRETDDQDEIRLAIAVRAIRRLIRAAYATSSRAIVGQATLEYVTRRETGEKDNERPFYVKHKANTIRKYMRHWVEMLCYLWRTQHVVKRPRYKFTAQQTEMLDRMKEVGGETVKDDRWDGKMRSAVLEFWISMFHHHLPDEEYTSGIISAIAVLGIHRKRGGWIPAIHFTPILSDIVTTLRALVVHRAWRQRREEMDPLRNTKAATRSRQATKHSPRTAGRRRWSMHS